MRQAIPSRRGRCNWKTSVVAFIRSLKSPQISAVISRPRCGESTVKQSACGGYVRYVAAVPCAGVIHLRLPMFQLTRLTIPFIAFALYGGREMGALLHEEIREPKGLCSRPRGGCPDPRTARTLAQRSRLCRFGGR